MYVLSCLIRQLPRSGAVQASNGAPNFLTLPHIHCDSISLLDSEAAAASIKSKIRRIVLRMSSPSQPLRTEAVESSSSEDKDIAAAGELLPLTSASQAISHSSKDDSLQPVEASSDNPKAQLEQCTNCHALENADQQLKPCTKCQTTLYCSRDCQKAGWKYHKKECPSLAQIYAQTHEPKMAVTRAPPKSTGRGGKSIGKWEYDT